MATISTCACYSDWDGKVSFFDDGIIYLTLNCKDKDLSYSFSLNPMQAKVLGEMLTNAVGLVQPDDSKAMLFGDLTMAIDVSSLPETDEQEVLGMDFIRIDEDFAPEVYRPVEKAA